MWELDYKESWALKNWCFWTVVLGKTLESPLDCKEIQPVHPKGNQSWIFIGRTDAKAENSNTLATWYKELTHWKKPWCWERLKAGGEGDNRGWDGYRLNRHEFEQAPGVGDGQGGLACCKSMGSQRVGHDWVTELNWTNVNFLVLILAGWLCKTVGNSGGWGHSAGTYCPIFIFSCKNLNLFKKKRWIKNWIEEVLYKWTFIYFKDLFLIWTILKVFIEVVTILLLFHVLVFGPKECKTLVLPPGIKPTSHVLDRGWSLNN